MDVGRSAFFRTFQFFAPFVVENRTTARNAFGLAPPRPWVRVRWYFAPPGAKYLPWKHIWGNTHWLDAQQQAECTIGEQPYEKRWNRGDPPAGATGQFPCGTEADFTEPKTWVVSAPPLKRGFSGLPLCCNPAGGYAFGLGNPQEVIVFAGLLAKINTFTPGNNPAHIPMGAPQTVIVFAATISGSGLPALVTSGLAGALTPLASVVGPLGQTFALSIVQMFSYSWSGAPDTLTISGIPGGACVLLLAVGFPGALNTLLAFASNSGSAQPGTLNLPGTGVGNVAVVSELYTGVQSAPAWASPFMQCAAFPVFPVWVNYDGTDFSLDAGFLVTPAGAIVASNSPGAGVAWATIGGVWQ